MMRRSRSVGDATDAHDTQSHRGDGRSRYLGARQAEVSVALPTEGDTFRNGLTTTTFVASVTCLSFCDRQPKRGSSRALKRRF